MAQASKYTADDIQVLEGLEPVRKRPGMYIGGTGKDGYHHLLWEIVDNSIDEVINKHATKVEVTLHKDGKSATVEDNGRGIPVDMMPKHKKSRARGDLHDAALRRQVRARQELRGLGRPARRRRGGRQRAVERADRPRSSATASATRCVRARRAEGQAQEARRRARHRHDRHVPSRRRGVRRQAAASTPS